MNITMTEEERINDLKQFIAVTVGQSEARLREDMTTKDDLQAFRVEVRDGFTGVGESDSQS
jgi:hypothetical protein